MHDHHSHQLEKLYVIHGWLTEFHCLTARSRARCGGTSATAALGEGVHFEEDGRCPCQPWHRLSKWVKIRITLTITVHLHQPLYTSMRSCVHHGLIVTEHVPSGVIPPGSDGDKRDRASCERHQRGGRRLQATEPSAGRQRLRRGDGSDPRRSGW